MSQQVYNIECQALGTGLVQTITPSLSYTTDEAQALEYIAEGDAMTAATYLTTTTGQQHVVVGPHPKPR